MADLLGEQAPDDLSGLPEALPQDPLPESAVDSTTLLDEDFSDLEQPKSWDDAKNQREELDARYTDSVGRHLKMTPEDSRRYRMLLDYGRGDKETYIDTSTRLYEELDQTREAFLKLHLKGHSGKVKDSAQEAYKVKLFELIGYDIQYQTGETARPELSTVIEILITEAQKREEQLAEMRAGTVGGKFRNFFRNHPGIRMGTAAAAFGGSLLTAKTGVLPEIATDTANYLATFMMGVAGYGSMRDSSRAMMERRAQKQDDELTASREEGFYGDKTAVENYIKKRQVGSILRHEQQVASENPKQNKEAVRQVERIRTRKYDLDDADEALMLRTNSEEILSERGLVELLKNQPESVQTYEVLPRLIGRQVDEEAKRIGQDRRHARISKLVGATVGVATLGMAALFGYQRIDHPTTSSND